MFVNVGSGGGGGASCVVAEADAAAIVGPSPLLRLCVKSRSISIAMSCLSTSDGATDNTDGGFEYSM
jgi:hypothetical protein